MKNRRVFSRAFLVVLAASLWADPATASGLYAVLTSPITYSTPNTPSIFNRQAIVPQSWVAHLVAPIRLVSFALKRNIPNSVFNSGTNGELRGTSQNGTQANTPILAVALAVVLTGHVGIAGLLWVISAVIQNGPDAAKLFKQNKQALKAAFQRVHRYLRIVSANHAKHLQGKLAVHVPAELAASNEKLEDLVARLFPESSHRMKLAEEHGLFDTLPVAFDPEQSWGPYAALVDKDSEGKPYLFLDFGNFGAKAFGDNRIEVIQEFLGSLHHIIDRYPHSEYQTALSLKFTERLGAIAPEGCPKVFICNTGAESVENAIKAALFKQELEPGEVPTDENAFLIHYWDAFHGRSMGALAATQSKKARQGFPTFDWPAVSFPYARFSEGQLVDNESLNEREKKSLREIWGLFVLGRNENKNRPKKLFKQNMETIDAFLVKLYREDLAGVTNSAEREKIKAKRVAEFIQQNRKTIHKDYLVRAENVTGIIVEPIQGEGGIRVASARYFQRLRMLSLLYDVPLIFDEVQTGFGRTGTFWSHEQFDLPAPPDIVDLAKVAQMGIVFVSDKMAKFFEAEKRFNTTWAGEPAGMLRVMRYLDMLDLAAVRKLGQYTMNELVKLQKKFPSFITSVRGRGLMLGFSIASPDKDKPSLLRDTLQELLFRRGLILNRASTEALRFYPRYDSTPQQIDQAVRILEQGLMSLKGQTPSGSGPSVPPDPGSSPQSSPLQRTILSAA